MELKLKDSVMQALVTTTDNVVEQTLNNAGEELSEVITDLEDTAIKDLKKQIKVEVLAEVKEHIVKSTPKQRKGSHLFACPTMIGIAWSLWVSVQPTIAEAIETKQFTASFYFDIFSKLLAAGATISLRGSEGTKSVYTNSWLPGLNKEEVDSDGNGIPDYLEV